MPRETAFEEDGPRVEPRVHPMDRAPELLAAVVELPERGRHAPEIRKAALVEIDGPESRDLEERGFEHRGREDDPEVRRETANDGEGLLGVEGSSRVDADPRVCP
jgi:hypothetical protein